MELKSSPESAKYTYPNVETVIKRFVPENGAMYYYVRLYTNLRKKHRGKWYKQIVLRECRFYSLERLCLDFSFEISEFTRTCYLIQLFGKVYPKQQHISGGYVFELDEDQRSEEDRLKGELYLKHI